MSFIKNSSIRWGEILLCLILGTWLGLFFQRFPATAALFANVVDFTIDIRQIDLVMVRVGFLFALKLNLGTLLGAVTGIVITR